MTLEMGALGVFGKGTPMRLILVAAILALGLGSGISLAEPLPWDTDTLCVQSRLAAIEEREEAVDMLTVWLLYYWSSDKVVAGMARKQLGDFAIGMTNKDLGAQYIATMASWDKLMDAWAVAGGKSSADVLLLNTEYKDNYHRFARTMLDSISRRSQVAVCQ